MSQNVYIGMTLKPWPILLDHYTDTESKKKNKATVGNGEANGRLTISGEAKRVGEVGLQLEKSGGKLVSGQTNLDGSATATYSFGGDSSGGWSYCKYSDLYAETASTIGNGAVAAVGNLIPDMVNGIAGWTERFLHQDSGSLGRMDLRVDVDNEVAQGVANDFRKIAAVGTAMVPVIRRSTSSSMEQYNFANSPALHMTNPARYVPVQLLDQVIKGSKGFPDPQGSVALMHYMRIWRNETPYNLEVLYHKNTNTILHFEHARKKMGPLDAIKK
ncbi:hypothetical protein [Shewanella baltica]|uniref:hypothetical protein n=1 Tax=Shewanella baltica TaxID=62322 RepID=UPI00325E1FF5